MTVREADAISFSILHLLDPIPFHRLKSFLPISSKLKLISLKP